MDDRERVCDVLVADFAARHDAYTRWSGQHWSAVTEPLTGAVALRAIEERVPVSGYIIAPGSVSHVWAFDVDLEDGWDVARLIGTTAWNVKVPCYAERSRRGAHLWGVIDRPLPARTIRRALHQLLALAAVPADPRIELRPAQDEIAEGGYGNSLRLPTMPHPKTGRRSALYDPRTGEPIGDRLSTMLVAVETVDGPTIEAIARAYRPPLDPKLLRYDPMDTPPRPHGGPDEESASEILRTLWGVGHGTANDPFPRPGKAVKCPLHDDRSPSLTILPDDRRVICHSVVCEMNNDGHGLGTYQLRKLAHERVVPNPPEPQPEA